MCNIAPLSCGDGGSRARLGCACTGAEKLRGVRVRLDPQSAVPQKCWSFLLYISPPLPPRLKQQPRRTHNRRDASAGQASWRQAAGLSPLTPQHSQLAGSALRSQEHTCTCTCIKRVYAHVHVHPLEATHDSLQAGSKQRRRRIMSVANARSSFPAASPELTLHSMACMNSTGHRPRTGRFSTPVARPPTNLGAYSVHVTVRASVHALGRRHLRQRPRLL